MELIFPVFALGLMVSLVIAKGVMQANIYAKEELERLKRTPSQQDKDFEE